MTRIHTYYKSAKWHTEKQSDGRTWSQSGTFWQDPRAIRSVVHLNSFVEELKELNGFFALVLESNQQLLAAVDHVRSIPLFYGHLNGNFYLSDEADWVRRQVNDKIMDPVAKEEFQLTGYVTGQETLFPNVKQIQAGECLFISEENGEILLETQRYYIFRHQEPEIYNEDQLMEGLHNASRVAIQNLINFAGGRQIVVPLSGGYDSRLIVTLLKEMGYKNILTFSYGVLGNKESSYSKQVADKLGLDWHFVEYSNELWRGVWESKEFKEYQFSGSGLCSYAHIQDWPAIRKLIESGVIDKDCVVSPGHSGDFVAGSHIPAVAFKKENFLKNELNNSIYSKHYRLAPVSIGRLKKSDWLAKISAQLNAEVSMRATEFVDWFEFWNWQERQSKYICNSVRVYDYFGVEWWMPFWDGVFVSFWEKAPLIIRKDREFYVNYVRTLFEKSVGLDGNAIGNAAETRILKAKKILSKLFLTKRMYVYLRANFAKKNHPLAFYGAWDEKEGKNLLKKGYNVLGVGAKDSLDFLEKYSDK